MDLSKLKWPLIVAAIAGIIWLTTDPGVDYLYRRYSGDPGGDPERAERNEAALSRLAGFLMATLRFQRAEYVLEDVLHMYPEGKNGTYNLYRLSRVKGKLHKYEEAVKILDALVEQNAHAIDERVPENSVLQYRRTTLVEVHDLHEMRQ